MNKEEYYEKLIIAKEFEIDAALLRDALSAQQDELFRKLSGTNYEQPLPPVCLQSSYFENFCKCAPNYGCNFNEPKTYKQDCYFYEEMQDMNAHIPYCSYYDNMEPNDCNEQCKYYISKSNVFKLIKDKMEEMNNGKV